MSAYERYGGDAFWKGVLDRLYDKNLSDPDIAHFFYGKDIVAIKTMTRQLLKVIFGDGKQNFFTSIVRIHAGLGISQQQFQKFRDNLVQSLQEQEVHSSDLEIILDVINSFEDDIVTN